MNRSNISTITLQFKKVTDFHFFLGWMKAYVTAFITRVLTKHIFVLVTVIISLKPVGV